MGVRDLLAHSRGLVGTGYPVRAVARTFQISRQALYRRPKPRLHPQSRRPVDETDQAIIDVARSEGNASDGYRMVAAMVSRQLGRPVNRKRVLRQRPEHHSVQGQSASCALSRRSAVLPGTSWFPAHFDV